MVAFHGSLCMNLWTLMSEESGNSLKVRYLLLQSLACSPRQYNKINGILGFEYTRLVELLVKVVADLLVWSGKGILNHFKAWVRGRSKPRIKICKSSRQAFTQNEWKLGRDKEIKLRYDELSRLFCDLR